MHTARQRTVLIVSPHFVPASTPDMQRVRTSLPYFRDFGWTPYVLAVEPSPEDPRDPLLVETIPADVHIERVTPLPLTLTRRFGIGNIALRAWMSLLRAGSRTIAKHHIDLVYFSTTMFLSMPLGRIWHSRHGVPFVLDMQDPWLTDYYETHPEMPRPAKYGLSHRLHATLEPWTMARAGGIIAVSQSYIDTLRRRYPVLAQRSCATIPFAAAEGDFALLDRRPQPNRLFAPQAGRVNAVYVGRGGNDMAPALSILFSAVERLSRTQPALAAQLRMFFVGTD
ncbi:MAG: glycosyltransferase, partial [Acidobacteriaceae bacterium]|nr:glycosyltransferase [Acidobacteriaceae bacterium]